MHPARSEWEQLKLDEIDECRRALEDARKALTDMVHRSHARGLDVEELHELAPASFEIARLRMRRHRLADELDAISAEWAA